MATTLNALARQPTELDYADPTKFKFSITKLPKVEFFTTQANIPGINLGESIFPTPFKQVPVMGDDLTFDNLEIEFIVDEKLENYRELHQWLVGIGFPKARTQFSSFRKDESQTFPTVESVKGDVTNPGTPSGIQAMFGDATLTVMTSKNNPVMEVRFSDLYPVALGGLAFNQQETDINYLTATATFTYKLYEMFTI
mgnify:FL=1|tara:strand:- start:137 stop:727 length:591 start_codon:yes stop_codon:yes gene_type:complete